MSYTRIWEKIKSWLLVIFLATLSEAHDELVTNAIPRPWYLNLPLSFDVLFLIPLVFLHTGIFMKFCKSFQQRWVAELKCNAQVTLQAFDVACRQLCGIHGHPTAKFEGALIVTLFDVGASCRGPAIHFSDSSPPRTHRVFSSSSGAIHSVRIHGGVVFTVGMGHGAELAMIYRLAGSYSKDWRHEKSPIWIPQSCGWRHHGWWWVVHYDPLCSRWQCDIKPWNSFKLSDLIERHCANPIHEVIWFEFFLKNMGGRPNCKDPCIDFHFPDPLFVRIHWEPEIFLQNWPTENCLRAIVNSLNSSEIHLYTN